jgi:hypothetical protein
MILTNRLLLLSGSGFGCIFIFCSSWMPIYFQIILLNQSILTLLFWINPMRTRNSIIHKIDGFNAKLLICSFILYKWFIYRKYAFYFTTNTSIGLYFYHLSDKHSRHTWCSQKHLLCHFIAHIYSCVSILIAIL